jgi:hypothetical protein
MVLALTPLARPPLTLAASYSRACAALWFLPPLTLAASHSRACAALWFLPPLTLVASHSHACSALWFLFNSFMSPLPWADHVNASTTPNASRSHTGHHHAIGHGALDFWERDTLHCRGQLQTCSWDNVRAARPAGRPPDAAVAVQHTLGPCVAPF